MERGKCDRMDVDRGWRRHIYAGRNDRMLQRMRNDAGQMSVECKQARSRQVCCVWIHVNLQWVRIVPHYRLCTLQRSSYGPALPTLLLNCTVYFRARTVYTSLWFLCFLCFYTAVRQPTVISLHLLVVKIHNNALYPVWGADTPSLRIFRGVMAHMLTYFGVTWLVHTPSCNGMYDAAW